MIRIRVVNIVIVVLFLTLILGLINLEVLQGSRLKALSNKNCIRLLPQQGSRGKILDRDNNIIVDNKLTYDLMISVSGQPEADKLIVGIAKVLGVSKKELRASYKNNYIISTLPVLIAKNIDIKKAIALGELKFDLPGIIIQENPLRNYRFGNLGCHIIGYLNEIDRWRLTKLADYGYKTKDIVGFGGLEEKYDYYLRQEEGGLSIEVDHKGRTTRILGFKSPLNGKDIGLTLNLKIQRIVEDKLKDKNGCVILMEPYTGEILAMASSPGFNPGAFLEGSNQEIVRYFNNTDSPLINRAISSSYPAGSIFKTIVATAALEGKKINSHTTFLCPGRILVGKQEFGCWEKHGVQNLHQALTHSCNVFFYRTGLLVGAQPLHDYALKFGLSKPIPFELPYEADGFIPSPLWRRINKFKSWFDGDTINLSIGQGEVLVTPLQIVRLIAIFANKGYLVTPYMVKTIGDKDIATYQRRVVRLSLKESTINYIRQGLRGVVESPTGTANILSTLPVAVAGKTGTAQAPPGQPHAWFTGFFPYDQPKYAICVFLEHAGPGYYSCVMAKQIIEQMSSEGLL